jgi:formate hydrogenlyase subunit 4
MTVRFVHVAVHIALILALPPLLLGVINKTKARFAGRVGPPLLQAYYDLAKLLRKECVLSRTTTWVFLAGPVVSLVATLLAALLVPLAGHAAPIAFDGDFVLFAYVLGLGRFFTVAAALDTGSAFEGMGGAREVTFSALAEPTLFFGVLVLARASGSYSLSGMLGPAVAATWSTAAAALAAVLASWFVVLLAENSRVPFDDPNTHLELTMIHEVMVLDHGGPDLAFILHGAAVKFFLFAAILVRFVLPLGADAPLAQAGLFLVGLLLVAVLVGTVESSMARLRLIRVPALLGGALVLATVAIAVLFSVPGAR